MDGSTSSTALRAALDAIAKARPAVLVTIEDSAGSVPRAPGTAMLVTKDALAGTVGGGAVEHRAVMRAREILAGESAPGRLDLPLGPALSMCCGGHVGLGLRLLGPGDAAWIERMLAAARESLPRVVVFGAGHVGTALVRALVPLPCRITWVDCRKEIFPISLEGDVDIQAGVDPLPVAEGIEEGAFAAVMTHSHPLDLDICERLLRHGRAAWTGLIGSMSKRRRFESQLRARGIAEAALERLVCPIGLAGIRDKAPPAIAASVAAQLLIAFEAVAALRQRDALR